jgi:hypothetical protein
MISACSLQRKGRNSAALPLQMKRQELHLSSHRMVVKFSANEPFEEVMR